ncbi:MAG: class I SAM-dependent methyltransferase [Candidatus Eiseniibacteriota bacterium]
MRPRDAVLIGTALLAWAGSAAAAEPDTTAAGVLREEAASLKSLAHSSLGRQFLAATALAPQVAARVVWTDSSRTHAWTESEAALLPDTTRARLIRRELDDNFYWNTRYGSPLAYLRPLEILSGFGVKSIERLRFADFGCGTIGHLRLLASLGADATGIDVDPLLRALYSEPGDLTPVPSHSGHSGQVRLVIGQWPAQDSVRAAVGSGYDLILSKNTLKNGYIHPAQPVNPRMLVHLGVADSAYVAELYRALKPGGHVLIYNLCPAPAASGQPYIPWADGRCPFAPAMWRAAGFEVLAFDQDDSPRARAMGHALHWDRDSGMDLENGLFATWSLFRKPR